MLIIEDHAYKELTVGLGRLSLMWCIKIHQLKIYGSAVKVMEAIYKNREILKVCCVLIL